MNFAGIFRVKNIKTLTDIQFQVGLSMLWQKGKALESQNGKKKKEKRRLEIMVLYNT